MTRAKALAELHAAPWLLHRVRETLTDHAVYQLIEAPSPAEVTRVAQVATHLDTCTVPELVDALSPHVTGQPSIAAWLSAWGAP